MALGGWCKLNMNTYIELMGLSATVAEWLIFLLQVFMIVLVTTIAFKWLNMKSNQSIKITVDANDGKIIIDSTCYSLSELQSLLALVRSKGVICAKSQNTNL